jgi:hypothetical protein
VERSLRGVAVGAVAELIDTSPLSDGSRRASFGLCSGGGVAREGRGEVEGVTEVMNPQLPLPTVPTVLACRGFLVDGAVAGVEAGLVVRVVVPVGAGDWETPQMRWRRE